MPTTFPQRKIITLLTDFGSIYPSQMKGVILSRLSDVALVDIAHDIPAQNIRAGAFALMTTVRYFPKGTIHLAVVDPGVGTKRRGIAVQSGGHVFVGPDNGLLIPAARSLGVPKVRMISQKFEASFTFHGRDIFAPMAATLAEGESFENIGPRVDPVELDFGKPHHSDKGIESRVIFVDHFGNLILNLAEVPEGDLKLKDRHLKRVRTYAEAKGIEPLITIGSHGFAEIAVNQGSAADVFGLAPGDLIVLERANCSE